MCDARINEKEKLYMNPPVTYSLVRLIYMLRVTLGREVVWISDSECLLFIACIPAAPDIGIASGEI